MVVALDRRLVAVMFTDMAGYTALLQADERLALDRRERYWDALERHHEAFGGTIVQRLGDGSMSMFPSSLAAVQAAVAVQQELAPQDVLVRIGVHSGEVVVEPERLTGDAVNVAARIESFAVPGGVLLSDAAYEQIKNRSDVVAVPLGRFRLKNVGRAFELFAVSADGLVVPDARALEGKGERFASLPSSLPTPAVPLVGRTGELAALTDLVRTQRVVTITGPGGVGKTRVLIELGRLLAAEFPDALAFITLADVSEPAAFLPTLATALDVKEAEERTLLDGIVSLIGDRPTLLLLDNFEQIVAVAPEVATLIERCPMLRIVVTSRAPLRLAAEHEFSLGPLALPSGSEGVSPESVAASPAVVLFVQRARSARGSFDVTADNAGAIAAICRRLDGLPLALELAAARSRLLSPDALLERLDHALDVLTSANRDSPGRQQTLRATIDWSHSLLTEPEQRLFRRMALFAGGCAFGDVEAVCADAETPSLDGLESLVDKALVQVDAQDRLQMLETIREYARERLEAAGESDQIALRHAHRYAALAREVRDGIEGTTQQASIEQGVADEANLEAALGKLLDAARAGDADALEAGLQLCGDLWMYWHIRGKHLTARDYTARFLQADGTTRPHKRSRGRTDHGGASRPGPSARTNRRTNSGQRRLRARRGSASRERSASPRHAARSACLDPTSRKRRSVRARAPRRAARSASPGLRPSPRASTGSSTLSRETPRPQRRSPSTHLRFSGGSATTKEPASPSVLSPNSRRAVTTSSTRSICTVRRSQPSKRSEIAQRKRASCRKWRGRISGSKTPQPHAGTSSSPFGHTPSSRASVESASR